MNDPTAHDWWIGLSSWILQDGNYTEFVVGERRQFALEFGYSWANRLQPVAEHRPPEYSHVGRGVTYEVTADVVRSADPSIDDAFVLDFGLAAYKQHMVLDDLGTAIAGHPVGW